MSTQEAVNLLLEYNKWRRGDETIEMPIPYKIGAAIDTVCAYIGTGIKPNTHGYAADQRFVNLTRNMYFRAANGWEEYGVGDTPYFIRTGQEVKICGELWDVFTSEYLMDGKVLIKFFTTMLEYHFGWTGIIVYCATRQRTRIRENKK